MNEKKIKIGSICCGLGGFDLGCKNVGFETIYETQAGATITSHCGENTLGILFLNK